jgi:hypothetical protein
VRFSPFSLYRGFSRDSEGLGYFELFGNFVDLGQRGEVRQVITEVLRKDCSDACVAGVCVEYEGSENKTGSALYFVCILQK